MREFKFSQSTSEITGQSSLALIGQALRRHTQLTQELNQLPLRHGIQHADVVESYLGLLCVGKNDFLKSIRLDLKPLYTGHVPLDADVTIMDNSGSRKEGVSRAYSGVEGYAPMIMYLGNEGYCLELELREGRQHVQRGTPAFKREPLPVPTRMMSQAL